jgi:hypothetical protein
VVVVRLRTKSHGFCFPFLHFGMGIPALTARPAKGTCPQWTLGFLSAQACNGDSTSNGRHNPVSVSDLSASLAIIRCVLEATTAYRGARSLDPVRFECLGLPEVGCRVTATLL